MEWRYFVLHRDPESHLAMLRADEFRMTGCLVPVVGSKSTMDTPVPIPNTAVKPFELGRSRYWAFDSGRSDLIGTRSRAVVARVAENRWRMAPGVIR